MKDFYLVIIATLVIIVAYDIEFVCPIIERGGFAAWMHTNCLWSHAIALSVMLHVVAAVVIWACIDSIIDENNQQKTV